MPTEHPACKVETKIFSACKVWQNFAYLKQKNVLDTFFHNMLDLHHKLYAICLALFFIVVLYNYRSDGLLFVLIISVYIFCIVKKYILSGKGFEYAKRQIVKYGYNKYIGYLILPRSIYRACDVAIVNGTGFWVALISIAHIYMSVIIIANKYFAIEMDGYLKFINKQLHFLISAWPSFQKTVTALHDHGYSHRVAMIEHSYLLSFFIVFLFTVYFVKINICRFYECIYPDKMHMHFKRVYKGIKASLVFSFFVHIMGACIYLFHIINVGMPFAFPGEKPPGTWKHSFLLSYAYINDTGIYAPLYIIPAIQFLIVFSTVYLFKIFIFYKKEFINER